MSTLLSLLGLIPATLFAVKAESGEVKPQRLADKAVVVGDFSVLPLLDGTHSFPLNFLRGADEAVMQAMAGGPQAPGSFNVFLIKHGRERFLVDTGNGTLRPERQGRLLLSLQEAKIMPEDIGKIFITHLHGDHIGGLLKDGKPAFPKARVYVPKVEYDYWLDDVAMFPLVHGVLRVLEQDKLLVFFTPGEDVSPGITSMALFGHTQGHTGFMLASKGEKMLFVGDLLHAEAIQFARPDVTLAFDADQSMARETRLRTFKQVVAEAVPIAATHLPFPGIGLVRPAGCAYSFEPLK